MAAASSTQQMANRGRRIARIATLGSFTTNMNSINESASIAASILGDSHEKTVSGFQRHQLLEGGTTIGIDDGF